MTVCEVDDMTVMTKEVIVEGCRNVWQSVLGLDLCHSDDGSGPDLARGESTLASFVKVNGDWKGAILIECPKSVTRHAAAMLFASDVDSLPEEDLQDAVNELTRLVGKHLQKVIAPTGKISAPKTADSGGETAALSDMKDRVKVDLSCEGRPVRISVLESQPAPVS